MEHGIDSTNHRGYRDSGSRALGSPCNYARWMRSFIIWRTRRDLHVDRDIDSSCILRSRNCDNEVFALRKRLNRLLNLRPNSFYSIQPYVSLIILCTPRPDCELRCGCWHLLIAFVEGFRLGDTSGY